MSIQDVAIVAKRKTWLQNSDAKWDDEYGYPTIVVEVGDTVDVLINKYDDGRIYYTAYRLIDGKLYTATSMRDKDGEITENCGDGPISRNQVRKALGAK